MLPECGVTQIDLETKDVLAQEGCYSGVLHDHLTRLDFCVPSPTRPIRCKGTQDANEGRPDLSQPSPKMGIAGSVKIEVLVAPNGSAKSTQILGGHPVLAQAGVEAIRYCKWEAATHETKEVVIFNFHPN